MARTTIAQASFNSGELSPYMGVRIDQGRYNTGCKVLSNMLVAPHGAAYRRPGMRFVGKAVTADAETPVKLIPFVFNESQAYMLEFSNGIMRVWHKKGIITNESGTPYTIETPYAATHLHTLRVCQSADVMFIVSPEYPPYRLERYGHANWRLVKVSFSANIAAPQGLSASSVGETGRTYRYVVTSIGPLEDEESLPSAAVSCDAAKSLSTTNYTTIAWNPVVGASEYFVCRMGGGASHYGFLGRAKGTRFEDRGQSPDFTRGVPEHRDIFDSVGNYPSVVQFYQQRLCFASTKVNPQTVWTSRTGNYQNFNISRPLQADDACTITIAADKVSAVRWMVAGKKLLIGSVDGEWAIGGYNGEALNPSSCEVDRQGSRGSANLPAIVVGDSILFAQRGANSIRDFRYSLDMDGYNGSDLSILGEHILRHRKIVDLAWQQTPHSVLWCVLDDGTMAGLSLVREHEIVAWHRHSTDGHIEAVASMNTEHGDEVWFVVRRTVWDSVSQTYTYSRTIEVLDNLFEGDDATHAFFVDSGLTWNGVAVSTVLGLEHLEGKEVQILADGYVHPPQTVHKGTVTLHQPASVIHIGLGYNSDIAPMASEPAEAQGVSLGMVRRVGRVRFRLYNTLGCQVGPHHGALRSVLFRHSQHPLGKGLPLFTGDKEALIDTAVSSAGGVYFRQNEPLPFTLLAVAHEVEVGEV